MYNARPHCPDAQCMMKKIIKESFSLKRLILQLKLATNLTNIRLLELRAGSRHCRQLDTGLFDNRFEEIVGRPVICAIKIDSPGKAFCQLCGSVCGLSFRAARSKTPCHQ